MVDLFVCSTVSCTVSTTGHQDTTMDATGPCGSCLCLVALMLLRCWRSFKRLRLHTPMASSVSLDLTTFAKCSASASSPTSPQASKSLKNLQSICSHPTLFVVLKLHSHLFLLYEISSSCIFGFCFRTSMEINGWELMNKLLCCVALFQNNFNNPSSLHFSLLGWN